MHFVPRFPGQPLLVYSHLPIFKRHGGRRRRKGGWDWEEERRQEGRRWWEEMGERGHGLGLVVDFCQCADTSNLPWFPGWVPCPFQFGCFPH